MATKATPTLFVRSAYNYDPDEVSRETGLHCLDDSLTQQQFAAETDINEIVRRFGLTGEMPDDPHLATSGDFTNVMDFRTAMEAIRKAEEGFMELPPDMRMRFSNDPQLLLEFLDNPNNRDEALKLGLIVKPPEKTRDAVTAIDELAGKLTPTTPKV